MNDSTVSVTQTRIKDSLLVTLPDELGPLTLSEVQRLTLDEIQHTMTASVILECSAVKFMDAEEFEVIRSIASMAAVLGASPLMVGLKPEIIKYLVQTDLDVSGIQAFLGLNDALDYLDRNRHRDHQS